MDGLKLKGKSQRVVKSIDEIDHNFKRGIRQGWFRSGDKLIERANEQVLKKPKSGRVYNIRKGNRLVRHRASAPGQSPANRTGTYRKSLGYKIRGWRDLEFGSTARGNAPYSVFLEQGTQKMKPRPGLGNAVKVEEGKIQRILEAEIKKALT